MIDESLMREQIMSIPSLLHEALRLNQRAIPAIKAKLTTMRFLRLAKSGELFTWHNSQMTYFEINGRCSIHYLQKVLVETLKKLLSDHTSFIHTPLLADDDSSNTKRSRSSFVISRHEKQIVVTWWDG